MPPAVDRDLELCADAVVGRDQDRIAKSGGLQVEQPAEPAQVRIRARPPRGLDQRFDGMNQRIAASISTPESR